MDAKVYSVEKVCIHVNKSNPAELVVVAGGTVNSSGWSNGRLVPHVYIHPPADGVQDFDFIAEAPSGFVLWWMAPIAGSGRILLTDWMKGARVHASSNTSEALLSDPACVVEASGNGGTYPWPWVR